ncbi:MAG: hypothetical protein KGH81_02550 [Thaumarchaeota archaeon]|nr:hypothetical protein [Nitrososphaerota archaeon]MDE1841474.1 hypothetical protein [Nitrososphaerota archaeon]MDE1878402.1 hypothetical protein [Nitrososphaerota archaeon]
MQLERLKQYSNISDIPPDPYQIPVDVAKRWIDYDGRTMLNTSEQVVYNQAMKISEESRRFFLNSKIMSSKGLVTTVCAGTIIITLICHLSNFDFEDQRMGLVKFNT